MNRQYQRELQRDILSVFLFFFYGTHAHHKHGRRSWLPDWSRGARRFNISARSRML